MYKIVQMSTCYSARKDNLTYQLVKQRMLLLVLLIIKLFREWNNLIKVTKRNIENIGREIDTLVFAIKVRY